MRGPITVGGSDVERSPNARAAPYWANTSSNDLPGDAFQSHAGILAPSVEALLRGERIARPVDEGINLSDIDRRHLVAVAAHGKRVVCRVRTLYATAA